MIIFYPDVKGVFNGIINKLYDENKGEDFLTSWEIFDSFIYCEGLLEQRISHQNPLISTSDLKKRLEEKKKEFSKIEEHLKSHRIKWLIEDEGLRDFSIKGIMSEYNVSGIDEDFRKETLNRAIEVMDSYKNYDIKIKKGKLPFFYAGGENSGVILMRKNHREDTGILGFYSNAREDIRELNSKFTELWDKSIDGRDEIMNILKNL